MESQECTSSPLMENVNCPPGLEYLLHVDQEQGSNFFYFLDCNLKFLRKLTVKAFPTWRIPYKLLIKQTVELFEAFTTFETKNKYKVLNTMGQQVFFAAEETDCCTRNCCGALRGFEMIISGENTEVRSHWQWQCALKFKMSHCHRWKRCSKFLSGTIVIRLTSGAVFFVLVG